MIRSGAPVSSSRARDGYEMLAEESLTKFGPKVKTQMHPRLENLVLPLGPCADGPRQKAQTPGGEAR